MTGSGIGTGTAAVRDAATVILLRREGTAPSVLMGRRGSRAAFMPSKTVFPGGAVDAADAGVPLATPLGPESRAGLAIESACRPEALAAAAIREVWEETGLRLAVPGRWDPPAAWRDFAAPGWRPAAHPLRYVFRAITPPGRPRRFDARFLLADAAEIAGDPDDLSAAQDELSHLAWVPLAETRALDMPFITGIVLAEIRALLRGEGSGDVPFYRAGDEEAAFERLGSRSPAD